jgi:THO complex subunit 4
VSNLHYEITPKDLISIFGQIGTLIREPLLRYDRSGRSIGEAIVSFETPVEATRAKKQFHGILAKGQPMSVSFYVAPRAPRRTASAPSTTVRSLLNRVEKPSLVERLTKEEADIVPPSGPRSLAGPARTRPVRGVVKPAARSPPKRKQPKTAEELDKELDAFMGDADAASASGNDSLAVAVGSDGTAAIVGNGDVDMV